MGRIKDGVELSSNGPIRASKPETTRALRIGNFRISLAAHSLSSTGFWTQSIALDWLVLQLTGSPLSVGIAMACQFLPLVMLGLYAGVVADRYSRRRVLLVTQSGNVILSCGLAALTLSDAIAVEQVYVFALISGVVLVFDNPTRQAFVNELVPESALRNAVAINSSVFQASRLVGPAIAAALIGSVGTGWAFAAATAAFTAPIVGLLLLNRSLLIAVKPIRRAPGQLREGVRHAAQRPTVVITLILVFVVGTFGLKFPVVLTGMADVVFKGGADLYAAFNMVLAVGSALGAFVASRIRTAQVWLVIFLAMAFGVVQIAAALAPRLDLIFIALFSLAIINLGFQSIANSSVQMWVDPDKRGRVMALYMLALLGGAPLGGPAIGWIASTWGPRIGMLACGLIPLLAAIVILIAVCTRREWSKEVVKTD